MGRPKEIVDLTSLLKKKQHPHFLGYPKANPQLQHLHLETVVDAGYAEDDDITCKLRRCQCFQVEERDAAAVVFEPLVMAEPDGESRSISDVAFGGCTPSQVPEVHFAGRRQVGHA